VIDVTEERCRGGVPAAFLGTEMASYSYDAFSRKVAKTAGGTTEETAWAGWQPLERYEQGQLAERRTYGSSHDEIVRLESDLDGDGTPEQSYTPVYDHTGNLAFAADSATGQIVERYRFDPYGERTILVDSTPPAVEQLRVKSGELWLEVSEGVQAEALQDSLVAGAVTLTDTATSTAVPLTAAQPIQEGRQAFRRIVLTLETPPTEGTTLELQIEPAALRDAFGNQLAVSYVQSFAWPVADQVLDDTAAPRIEAVRLVDRFVELELTEEPDLTTVASAVTVGGQGLAWTLSADRYTVRSSAAVPTGQATLSIANTLADLSASTLAEGLTVPVPATEQNASLLQAPDPRESFASTIANRAGFHGLDHDPTTGLLYVRNRWLDSGLGRFLQQDPLGYADGPSLYTFAGNNPANSRDPLGLYIVGGQREVALIRSVFEKIGAHEYAAQIRLDARPVSEEFRSNSFLGKLFRRPAPIRWETRITNHFAEWESSMDGDPLEQLAWLFDTIIDLDVRVEFSITNENLAGAGGAVTREEDYPAWYFHVLVNPSQVIGREVPVMFKDATIGLGPIRSVELAAVHEFGHVFGRTVGGTPSLYKDAMYGVHFENVYRALTTHPERWPEIRIRELKNNNPWIREEKAIKEIMKKRFWELAPREKN
jgi:RHS repeat-associated protein